MAKPKKKPKKPVKVETRKIIGGLLSPKKSRTRAVTGRKG